MKTMKPIKIILLLAAMLLMANTLPAQVDYLKQAREYLSEGNCDGAQTYYNLALELQLNNKRDATLERQIAECIGVPPAGHSDLTFTVKGVTFTMKYVEGGTFQMGGNDSESYNDEKPIHSVTLSGYYICETEVTQALWKAVMGTSVRQQRDKADPSWSMCGEGNDYPMYYVSYNEIVNEFLPELNRMTGQNFRLPTEAEWEYAAKGGKRSTGSKYAGSYSIEKVAWYTGNSGGQTHPVKTKSPNELGLYDMTGNVWEWCSDWYGDYSSYAQTNPKGPSSGSGRVLRGGSWYNNAKRCRVSNRGISDPDDRDGDDGFRLVHPQ